MDTKDLKGLMEAYSEVYAPREEIEEKFVDPSHGPFDDPKRIGMKSPNKNMMDKHKKLMSKGDPESTARAGKIAKAKLQTTLRAYGNNVDEATVVASPAPGGRGKKNPYTKEVRTSAPTKTSSGYSNVKDAKDRMKKPLSRYPKPEMQLKDVKEAQYTPPPQAQQPPAEVRKAPKKAPNPVTTVGTGLAAAYVGNEIGKQLLKKKPVRGVFEEVDIYDIILEHLLDEGFADTIESAEAIMVNMSEEWRDSIMLDEGVTLAQYKRKRQEYKDSQSGRRSSRVNLGPAGSEPRVERDMETRGAFGTGEYGGTTKNPKKLRKQKAMGEIGEQVDIYDIILSHLLDEGYAETVEAAEVIMVNMSEYWR